MEDVTFGVISHEMIVESFLKTLTKTDVNMTIKNPLIATNNDQNRTKLQQQYKQDPGTEHEASNICFLWLKRDENKSHPSSLWGSSEPSNAQFQKMQQLC